MSGGIAYMSVNADHASSFRRGVRLAIDRTVLVDLTRRAKTKRSRVYYRTIRLIVFGEKWRDDVSHRVRKFFMQRELACGQTHALHAGDGGEGLHF